eukprot:TRINITY_DN54107_c0_g1_i1.p1 TRINITY_DN54107_c0_g1~~TRINITY_DN54107_c0_g1_i1.p1  ORF type:complete len:352 (-),score=65.56 TRINITY_DN54107_c0_g1_i1:19-1074(-)
MVPAGRCRRASGFGAANFDATVSRAAVRLLLVAASLGAVDGSSLLREVTESKVSRQDREQLVLNETEAQAMAGLLGSAVPHFKTAVPKPVMKMLESMWSKKVVQHHSGLFNRKSFRDPKAQYTNVNCDKMEILGMTLQTEKHDDRFSSFINVKFNSECGGDYCWQSFGYTSKGKFISVQEGSVLLGFFPQDSDPSAEKPSMEGPGMYGDWCAPQGDFKTSIYYSPEGSMARFERRVLKDKHIFMEGFCRTMKEAMGDRMDPLEISPMHCNTPIGPLFVGGVIIIFQVMMCLHAYQKNIDAYQLWILERKACCDFYEGNAASAALDEDTVGGLGGDEARQEAKEALGDRDLY